jgi:hypothetical protein
MPSGKSYPIRKPPRGAPKHLREDPGLFANWWRLYRWANSLQNVFGAPVYLVGSALRDDNPDPRDWDIRIILSDRRFAQRYGPVDEWEDEGSSGNWGRTRHRWARECVKYAENGARHTQLNIDFQVYPHSHAPAYAGKPRLRLDNVRRRGSAQSR